MLGDIVKVTPSSKAVGDMSIFMVQNDLTPQNIYEKAKDIDFPDSIVSFFEGMMGQPEGGFPEKLQKLVLKDKTSITCRPGELLPDEDFDAIRDHLRKDFEIDGTEKQLLSYTMYPKVYEDYVTAYKNGETFSMMGSDIFFHGLREGETCEVKIEEGTTLVIKLVNARPTDKDGMAYVMFEVNGTRVAVKVKDNEFGAAGSGGSVIVFADENDLTEIGANIPGNILKILVKEGDEVEENQPVAVIEAMKMETNIIAPMKGKVDTIYVNEGQAVKAGELIVKLEG